MKARYAFGFMSMQITMTSLHFTITVDNTHTIDFVT